ncbi:MAG TPA: hypothetical protein P5284_01105 [Candidatus Contendobacter sp.]|nr:hypothetical protein [Candidatus Contendobacter sp.]HRZ22667.1 hypothetical protein [Candidatus Contendobacter sp.]HRZ51750.1 hypothetical protein [Candidatus Contendobacter sp.]
MKTDCINPDSLARTLAYHQASKHHVDRYAPGPGGPYAHLRRSG